MPPSTAPSRILMTADAVGGVWTYCIELIQALQSTGTEVCLAIMGPEPAPEQRAAANSLDNLRWFHKPFALEWMPDPWRDVGAAGSWLLALEEHFQPHAIHLNAFCHGSLPWSAPVLTSAHSCMLSWWEAVYGERNPTRWARYRTEVLAGLRGADLLTTPSRAMLASLGVHYPPAARQPECRVIPYGRDSRLFSPLSKRPFVLTAGRAWDEGKNIRVMDQVAREIPWPVTLAGSLNKPGTANQEHSIMDALVSLDCRGPLPPHELAKLMGTASIFALPARYEPFGISALEAALAGCSLVLGDIPSLREVWGDDALFAPPDNKDAITSMVRQLIDHTAFRQEMATRARARALQLTPQRMAESTYECYRGLVSRIRDPQEVDVL